MGLTKLTQVGGSTARGIKQEIANKVQEHASDKNNPHDVTKEQVGLGSVPNYPFTSAVDDPSATKFAAASAVKQAYDLATTKITKAQGDGYYLGKTANAASATKLATKRTIALSGDATGSVQFDGSANVTLAVTVANNSHTHVLSNITDILKHVPSKAMDLNTTSLNDLNSAAHAGFYFQDSNSQATPASSYPEAAAGSLVVLPAANGVTQTYTIYNNGRVWTRALYNGAWSAWSKHYTTVDKPTASDFGALTQAVADGRYLAKGAKAVDSDKLDGLDSTAFSRSTHTHTAAEVGACTIAQAQAYTNQEVAKLLGGAPSSALDTIFELGEALQDQGDAAAAMNTLIANHKADKNNPHGVTKAQVGLSNVNNWVATASVSDTSDTKYATAGAVQQTYARADSAYNLANGKISNFIIEDGDGTEVSITNGKEIKFVEGGNIDINWTNTADGTDANPFDLTFSVPNASTSARGAVQLSTATNSTSTTLAATPSAVKAAYDLAASKMTQATADGRYFGKTAKAAVSQIPAANNSATAGSGFGGFRYTISGTTLNLFTS